MIKLKPPKLKAHAIATLCLIFISHPAHAANKTAKDQPNKVRMVLMPLQVDGTDRNMLDRMEAVVIQGFSKQYEVLSSKQVIESLKKAPDKDGRDARKNGCRETGCLKQAAMDLQDEISALVHTVSASVRAARTKEGYGLTLDIKDILTGQTVSYISLSCRGCDQSQLVDKLKELSSAPAAMAATLQSGEVFRECAECPDMVVLPAGNFDMGSTGSSEKDEKPEHNVIIHQRIALGMSEVTRGQFAEFVKATGYDMGADADADDKCWILAGDKWDASRVVNWRNPGYPQDDNHPVTCISWIDAQAYVKWLALKTGTRYQLPAESEWEYACRAGGHSEYCGGAHIDSVAWYDKNSGSTTHPVAGKKANLFGLYDMSGNVGEWVEDSYHDRYNGAPVDGSAWVEDRSKRVLRGGSWLYAEAGARSTFRSVSAPEYRYFDSGFRVARKLP